MEMIASSRQIETGAAPPVDDDQLLQLYRARRRISRDLQNRIVHLTPTKLIRNCATRLGLDPGALRRSLSETQADILLDASIYAWRFANQTRIEKYLAECPPAADSPERPILQAMASSLYHLLHVTAVRPGISVQAKDLVRSNAYLIVDHNLSATASPGLVIASRLIRFPEFAMTTGAVMLLPDDLAADFIEVNATLESALHEKLPLLNLVGPEPPPSPKESEFALKTTANCLRLGGDESIKYLEP